MSNNTYYYFGAYLEIKVSKSLPVNSHDMICPNGHGKQGTYCAQCGARSIREPETMEYPSWIVGDLLDDTWENMLSVITPEELYKTGVIIAVGNLFIKPSGKWLRLGDYNSPATKEFPSDKEIKQMKCDLAESYADIISELRECKFVESVTVKAGYVLDEEY